MTKFKTFLLIIIFGLLSSVFASQTAFGQTENQVYLAEIDGEIKAGTLQYLKRVVREAEKVEAEYLVIKLDTPGGLLKSTKDIIDLLLKTEVKTVVFVHKEGGWAYSAGTFILLAADFAFVHPAASIGACQPQEMFGQEEVGDKIIEGTVSWIKSLAETQERNPEIAERFVRENLTLTGNEAKAVGIINETARNLDELFLKLEIFGPEIIKIQPTPIERFFDFLSHPYLISLFLTLGGLGLIFAFRTGEFELTGILGLILLFIGLWGMGVITFNFLGIIFLLLGIFLLLLEVFEPGFGVFGFLGIVSIVFGIFTLEGEPFLSPQIFEAATMTVLGAVLGIGILFIIIGRGVVKTFKTRPKTGSEALIGLEAEVIKELNPIGQVRLRGEIWQAESITGETIPEKTKVKIIKIEGNTLFVEKLG
ncbi:MAG: NfeD family protein [bacterium]|nr:NfeD family protein [bacterium]